MNKYQYRIIFRFGKYRNYEVELQVLNKFLWWTWWKQDMIRTGGKNDVIEYAMYWQKEFHTIDIRDLTQEISL